MSKVLITGVAGFIGSHLSEALLAKGYNVVGVDNFDTFYDKPIKQNNLSLSLKNEHFSFIEMDISSKSDFDKIPNPSEIDTVIHLAAKAGVRPSIEDPDGYLKANIQGTHNILEWMRDNQLKQLVFASSSSVYGNNKKIPFSETDNVDYPISPYAYTKKACELLIHTFHHLYDINSLCLRFFTVYGPRQRPDLAIHKFTRLIFQNQPITMYGDGQTSRDYTFVEDTVDGIIKSIEYINSCEHKTYDVINLGNNTPVKLNELIQLIQDATEKEVQIIKEKMQPGDVDCTFADIDKATNLLDYKPKTSMQEGLKKFVNWYKKTNG